MEVICLQDDAFYALIDKVIQHVNAKHSVKEDRWVLADEAMRQLGITSKTTLQKYRDEGKIRFTQGDTKPILYDVHSIKEYHEKNAKNTF